MTSKLFHCTAEDGNTDFYQSKSIKVQYLLKVLSYIIKDVVVLSIKCLSIYFGVTLFSWAHESGNLPKILVDSERNPQGS